MRISQLITALCLLGLAVTAHAQEIVSLSTRPGVTQSYFLASVPKRPQAIAVLFPGSGGVIRLRKEGGQIKFSGGNFLVRSRAEFVKRGVVTAIVDAPSDQQGGWGMTDEFRLGKDHLTDLLAVLTDLKTRFAGLPAFVVGTSRGSVSAAALGAQLGGELSGVVLTATMFRETGRLSREPGPGLSRFDFATIKAPLLFVHHVGDQCLATPYGDAARHAEAHSLITVFGGSPPQSDPCEAFSAHGFFGRESETVEQMVNWMLKRPFREEIR